LEKDKRQKRQYWITEQTTISLSDVASTLPVALKKEANTNTVKDIGKNEHNAL